MDVGRREQKKDRQTRSTADQGMDSIATQERTWMLSRGMAESRIGIGAVPGENGSAIDNQIAGTNQPRADGSQDAEHEKRFG